MMKKERKKNEKNLPVVASITRTIATSAAITIAAATATIATTSVSATAAVRVASTVRHYVKSRY